jgi:ABC-type nitrate/sulfonate/bicarbonate transport system substrate-binding protein
MDKIRLSLLRGVCQLPAYVAYEEGLLRQAGIDADLSIAPTAWMVPDRMHAGEIDFAVIPWTRVAADATSTNRLVVVCGSGIEEAAIVVRAGMRAEDVRSVAVPQEGGIKDLTAMMLLKQMGWSSVDVVRMPSGDGAILSFVGQGADAASMVEPYAAMLGHLGLGWVVIRTGDLWPGAPGCSLATTSNRIRERPDLVERMVGAYVKAASLVRSDLRTAAAIGAKFIGVSAEIVGKALEANQPNPDAIRSDAAMAAIVDLMIERGYIAAVPSGYRDLTFLDRALATSS